MSNQSRHLANAGKLYYFCTFRRDTEPTPYGSMSKERKGVKLLRSLFEYDPIGEERDDMVKRGQGERNPSAQSVSERKLKSKGVSYDALNGRA